MGVFTQNCCYLKQVLFLFIYNTFILWHFEKSFVSVSSVMIALQKVSGFMFCNVVKRKKEWLTFLWGLLIMKLLTLVLSLPANPGIYEAITGNFLDSYNLSLLNPYMVRVFCNWFRSFYYAIMSMNICWMQPNLSASWLFQRAMSAKHQSNVPPDFISELLYVNFQSMQVGLF